MFTQSEHSFDFKNNVAISQSTEYSEEEEDLESKERRDRGGRKHFIQLKFFLKKSPSTENKTVLNPVKDNQVDEKAQHSTAHTDLNWIC